MRDHSAKDFAQRPRPVSQQRDRTTADGHCTYEFRRAKRPLLPSKYAPFVDGPHKKDEPQQSTKLQLKQFGRKAKVSHFDSRRFCQCELGRAESDRVDGHQAWVSRLRTQLSKVETTPAFVYGWALPGDFPLTGRTLVE